MRHEGDARDFIESNYARLTQLAVAVAGNQHDGADLLHDTLEKLYRRWSRTTVDNPWGLAKTIMVRTSIDRYRRRRHEVLTSDWLDVPGEPLLHITGENDELLKALSSIPLKQRAAVALRFLEDMSYPDIAGVMGISEVGVRTNVTRGTAAIRARLAASEIERTEST